MGSYLNNRVLKINVGFLLNDGPAHSQDSVLDIPTVRVSDDLILDYVRGPIRLTRTHEGILLQGEIEAGISDECYRCLENVQRNVTFGVEELFSYHSQVESEFKIGDDAILDLSPLLRAEVFIGSSHRTLCRPDCKGLCPNCGANRNYEQCTCEDDEIDPRFEVLKKLLNQNS